MMGFDIHERAASGASRLLQSPAREGVPGCLSGFDVCRMSFELASKGAKTCDFPLFGFAVSGITRSVGRPNMTKRLPLSIIGGLLGLPLISPSLLASLASGLESGLERRAFSEFAAMQDEIATTAMLELDAHCFAARPTVNTPIGRIGILLFLCHLASPEMGSSRNTPGTPGQMVKTSDWTPSFRLYRI